jgi:inner membrane protein
MDPVTHTIFGATLGEAGLKRWSRLAVPTLLVGANLPDVDAITYLMGTDVSVAWRRGVTHGVLALVLWPFALVCVMSLWHRWRPAAAADSPPFDRRQIFWLACISIWSHPTLDFLNNYGMRWLMPFSGQWFYGDTLFIVDPFILLVLFGSRYLARRGVRAGRQETTRSARVALAVVAVYIILAATLTVAGRAMVVRELAASGVTAQRLMVGPVPVNPFRKAVIAEDDDRYYVGTVSFLPTPHVEWQATELTRKPRSPLSVSAIRGPESRNFLSWSRFPYFLEEHTPEEDRVIIGDMRFPSGGTNARLGLVVRVPRNGTAPGP